MNEKLKNALGGDLTACCHCPMTGFYKDGYCRPDPMDVRRHTVCAVMSDEFLEFSKSKGNDLSAPVPEYDFPGLKAGDYWCLCAGCWLEALEAGVSPKIVLEATDKSLLQHVDIKVLQTYAVSISETLSKALNNLPAALESEIIEMAWCNKTTFEAIENHTGYNEKDVIALMQKRLKPSSFRLWRNRVSGRKSKHRKKSKE